MYGMERISPSSILFMTKAHTSHPLQSGTPAPDSSTDDSTSPRVVKLIGVAVPNLASDAFEKHKSMGYICSGAPRVM